MIDSQRLESIVSEAGRIAYDLWPGAGNALDAWEKKPGDPVCDADLAVDAFLKRELGALLPSAGWLSEETIDGPERMDNRLIWLVDPVDGTRDFIRGHTGWAVSVALISEGRPLMGMLSAPARGEEWLAVAGRGAWRNGKVLIASKCTDLSGARIPADSLMKEDQLMLTVEKPNSIALRVAMVAADEADVIATLRWGFEWDLGAAALIARESGAAVSDAFGHPFGYNKRDPRSFGLIASAPGIHAQTIEHLAVRANILAAKPRD